MVRLKPDTTLRKVYARCAWPRHWPTGSVPINCRLSRALLPARRRRPDPRAGVREHGREAPRARRRVHHRSLRRRHAVHERGRQPRRHDRASMGRKLTEAQRRRWMDLMIDTADEVGLPADPEFRSAFVAYLEWGTRLAVMNSQEGEAAPWARHRCRSGTGDRRADRRLTRAETGLPAAGSRAAARPACGQSGSPRRIRASGRATERSAAQCESLLAGFGD